MTELLIQGVVELIQGVLALVVVVAIVIALAALYFLPTLVAGKRCHRNANAILLLNLLAGWTFIGWVVALVWAATDNVERTREVKS